jgi:hypothetical protein
MSKFLLCGESFAVEVDYSLSLSRMIIAGQFQYVAAALKANSFTMAGRGILRTTMHFAVIRRGCEAKTEEVLDWMAAKDLRAANLEELLALAAVLPAGRLTRDAHALGSVGYDGQNPMVVTCSLGRRRCLRCTRLTDLPWMSVFDCFPCSIFAH